MRLIYFLLNLSQLLVLKTLTHFLPRGWNATPHNPAVYSFPIRNLHLGTHAVQSLRLDLWNQMACLNPAQHFKNRPRKLGSSRGSELCIIRFQGSEKTFSLSAGWGIINYFKLFVLNLSASWLPAVSTTVGTSGHTTCPGNEESRQGRGAGQLVWTQVLLISVFLCTLGCLYTLYSELHWGYEFIPVGIVTKNRMTRGLRDGWVVKTICCFLRGPKFNPQHPHKGLTIACNSISKGSDVVY